MKYGITIRTQYNFINTANLVCLKLKNILSENISFKESKDNNSYFWYNQCDTVRELVYAHPRKAPRNRAISHDLDYYVNTD